MKTKNSTIWLAVVLTAIIAVIALAGAPNFHAKQAQTGDASNGSSTIDHPLDIAAVFDCAGGNRINATFHVGEIVTSTQPDQPPLPTGSVVLQLSDGRNMTLAQTISADGGRYASADGSIVFWVKGSTAMFTQNDKAIFTNCTAILPGASY